MHKHNMKKYWVRLEGTDNEWYLNDIRNDEPDIDVIFLLYKIPKLIISRVDGKILAKQEILKLVTDFFWCLYFDDWVYIDIKINGDNIEIMQSQDDVWWHSLEDVKLSIRKWVHNVGGSFRKVKDIQNDIRIYRIQHEDEESKDVILYDGGDKPSWLDLLKKIKQLGLKIPIDIYSTSVPETHEDEKMLRKNKLRVIDYLTFTEQRNNDLFLHALSQYDDSSSKYPTFNYNEYQRIKTEIYKDGTNEEKKNTLENLAKFIFESIPHLEVIKQPLKTEEEEVDLLIKNESLDRFLQDFGTPFAVECRNRKEKVGNDTARNFKGKISNLGIRCLIIISVAGYAKPSYKTIKNARYEGKMMIPVTGEMLEKIYDEKVHPIEMFKKAYYSSFSF